MNITLTILGVLLLLFFGLNQYLKYKRFKYVNQMSIIYDKMEMHFVRNKVTPKKDYLEFLKIFKNIIVNSEFLDIQVLLLLKAVSEKQGKLDKDHKWYNKVQNELGVEFLKLSNEFDYYSTEIIKLSLYKPDFMFFYARKTLQYLIFSGTKRMNQFFKDLEFVKRNEEVIVYSGLKLQLT